MKKLSADSRTLLRKILLILAFNFCTFLPIMATFSNSTSQTTHPSPHLAEREIECIDCHKNAIPSTPPKCKSCHQVCTSAQNKGLGHSEIAKKTSSHKEQCLTCHETHFLPQHYGKHCQQCHQTLVWEIVSEFTVSNRNCISCHEKEIPPRHYQRTKCFLCHQSSTWQQTNFEHVAFERCERCHTRPKKHRTGDCIFCHDSIDWGNAS